MLNALTAEARSMQCNFKIDRYKFHSIGFVGFLTKKITTQVGFSPASLPVVIVKCPVIPYPVGKFLGLIKYIIFFLRIRNPRVTTVTAFNKSMAEVNCVSLKDIRTFCHATRFRFSHKILKVSSVDSLLFLSELHLTLQLRFNFKESRL